MSMFTPFWAFRSAVFRVAGALALLWMQLQGTAMAEPIGWMERFALADDREAVLAELIPGSDDFYFYHCLNAQTKGRLEQSEAFLADWLAEHKGQPNATINAMLDRQRLLTYEQSPQRTIDHLVARLGIQFNHAPPATRDQRRFPNSLDAALIDPERLIKEALNANDTLKPASLAFLANKFLAGDSAGYQISVHDLLARISTPSIEGLDTLVIQELASRKPNEVRFGDLPAHACLTLAELERVAAKVPAVADDNEFVAAMLKRLRPSADTDMSRQADVRYQYLKRIETYVRTLPPSYHSLQASATYRLLEANLTRGVFDRDLFIRYLALPRVSPIVNPLWLRRNSVHANLNDDFMSLAMLPPIHDDESVVSAHLEHFLKDAPTSDAFAGYLQPEYLRRVFAMTKLRAGVGDEAQWYKLLSGSERQALRDKIELRLTPDNPATYTADEATTLKVDVKNIDELIVRVYEINTEAYYRTNDKQLDTDVDLDGLIATSQRTLEYDQPAIIRHRESITLDEITGRGVWVVDLVGKGVRARALVRRGSIEHVDSVAANGMSFTIVDENRQPIPDATMWVGARQFVADETGRVVIPAMSDATSREAVISDGKIARKIQFSHLQEQYTLSAGMHVDRTQLQSGGKTDLLIRPRLTMGGLPIDPETLSDVSVQIFFVDLDNITTEKKIEQLELNQNAELVIPISVPSRLSTVSVSLAAKIEGLADGKQQTLSTTRAWDVAGIRTTQQTHDSFLTRDGQNFVIEVRGRNGERVANASVNLSLVTRYRNNFVQQNLQADENGRIDLGKLDGVTELTHGVVAGIEHRRQLPMDQTQWPNAIHTVTGQTIELPWVAKIDDAASLFRLVERRGDGFHAEHNDRMSIDNGMLLIRELAAGDYQLIERATNRTTEIAVVDGSVLNHVAVGDVRHLETSRARPLAFASLDQENGDLKIKLSGEFSTARVHVFASRYIDSASPIDALELPFPGLTGRRVPIPHCGYVSDLRLGDEYLYVLRRQFASKYAGVMLPQPSVILNPWATEETTNSSQSAQAGDAVPPSAAPSPKEDAMARQQRLAEIARAMASEFDFLADPGVVLTNLRPDENGVVTIPGDIVNGIPVVQIMVCDAATMIQRTWTSKLEDAETMDLRLAKSLDVTKAYSMQRSVLIASPDAPLDLQSLGSAQVRVYGDVNSLWKLYRAMIRDPRLTEFDALANWNGLDRNQKLRLYSNLASHELHLFLWSYDRAFFDEIIRPYLANKKEKQFVDHWLLDDDLTPYSVLWRYNELNAAERAMLAMRLPSIRESIIRQLSEIVAEQETDQDATRRGIESALRQTSESEEEMLGESRFGVDRATVALEALSMGRSRAGGSERTSRAGFLQKAMEMENRNWAAPSLSFFDKRVSLGDVAFYQNLDATKQWAESQWDRVRTVGGSNPDKLIPVNGYWAHLAKTNGDSFAVSTELLRPIDNRHAALVALAFSGLPMTAGEIALPTAPETQYKPAHAVAVATKRLRELTPSDDHSLLIGQRFERADDVNASAANQTSAEPDEFLVGTAYRGQTVISNPTGQERTVDLFWQLPAGSLPLSGSQTTDSKVITLAPFAVQSVQYDFYFPDAGEFVHYPATVSESGELISRSVERTFKVVQQLTESGAVTWENVARQGSPEQITEFLKSANLQAIDWMLVAHRMSDADVYRAIINTLGQANLPIAELWAYSMKHRDVDAMRTYLSLSQNLVQTVGPVLNSSLLVVEPIERRTHELLEYAPLVRARIHRLGEENEILNPTFLAHYRDFIRNLAYEPNIATDDMLVLTYDLLIQNRIEEAIKTFAKIDRNDTASQLQYDYLDAFLAMHADDYGRAEKIARRYAEYPIPRWQTRFAMMADQLDQHKKLNQPEELVSSKTGKKETAIPEGSGDEGSGDEGSGDLAVMDRERRQSSASAVQPEVIVKVEGDSLRIDHRSTDKVTLNLYGVDLELLFSKAPFVREDLGRMAMVRPMRTETIKFDSPTGVGRFELDENLRRQTLLVEVVSGASRSTALSYGGDITTYVSESFGQLQTTDSQTRLPISKAYVKVYARYPDGDVRFYKDGYTDSRGRFDYASLSASDAMGATRYAILVISEERGATLHEVATPNN